MEAAETIMQRIDRLDWGAIQQTLDEKGRATTPPLLTPSECRELADLYGDDSRFRSRIDMARLRFGQGEYKYFANPLPPLVRDLRFELYPHLAETANRWLGLLGEEWSYPADLQGLLDRCHERGQTRPTPLILRYETGGYNALHQDLYGDVAFLLQVVFLLSRPGADFTGGELLLVEQRPRAQSRGEVITLRQGEGLIFPTNHRPVAGTRGHYRTKIRHGVSYVTSGTRYAMGIIFHDAK